ncbi:hypothetical protein EIP91_004553 [Steccherinum ochraceum]|uniref:Ribosome recycling factor domain-containing protein n=1 Tax=Steccherinum ochraceum TaxID=92696 RepID=A0A4R0R8L3_9APHY|nr:hypothetical protein EIP91_004553 [Steccherinum ochraceum]
MSLLRSVVGRVSLSSTLRPPHLSLACRAAWRPEISIDQTRSYASKRDKKDSKKRDKGGRDVEPEPIPRESRRSTKTDSLVPGSQLILAGEEYHKAEDKMKGMADKFKKEVAELETRASGRVTPSVLAPVRVVLPHSDGKGVRLEEVATVGVREGTTLIITVFEESSLKFVEQGIYDAKLPSIVPQKVDNQTIKVPMPKPTVEARLALFTSAQRKAEDYRTQMRKQQQMSIKKGAYAKHSQELDEDLLDKYIGEIDAILAGLKKVTGAK